MDITIDSKLIKKFKSLGEYEGLNNEEIKECLEDLLQELLEDYIAETRISESGFTKEDDSDDI